VFTTISNSLSSEPHTRMQQKVTYRKQKSYFWGQRKGLIKLQETWKRVFDFLILVENTALVITVIRPNTRTANYVARGYEE